MRLKLGILAPFSLQIGMTFLYSTITYETLEVSLLATIGLYIFPILIIYILSPQFIAIMTNMQKMISQQVNNELDTLVFQDRYGQEEGRTQLLENKFPVIEKTSIISDSIKSTLTPLISKRAYDYYKDNYYSRDQNVKQENSLEYYESMILFAGLTLVFFILDLIIVWIISFRSLNVYFITLDFIENKWITHNLTVLFIFAISVSIYLLRYATTKIMYYLPYAVPILFNEKTEEQYLRRETIRSLVDYNFDNLIDRSKQRAISKQIEEVMSTQLNPLLTQEIMITARTEFAHKLAWREYSKLIRQDILSKDESQQRSIELLSIGEQVGPVKIDEKDLLGLHSDVKYINYSRERWDELNEETRIFVYFQLYRVVEFILKQISDALELAKEGHEFNLYNVINLMYERSYLDETGKDELHNLRYRRNKLMHEIGASLDVSLSSMTLCIDALDTILENLYQEYMSSMK